MANVDFKISNSLTCFEFCT